jgi:hypothetical protein
VTPEPVSAPEHHLHSPRHCALIHVDSMRVEPAQMVIGQRAIVVWTAAQADASVVATF